MPPGTKLGTIEDMKEPAYLEPGRVYRLGQRAFLLFLSKRMKLAAFLLALTGLFWWGRGSVAPEYFELADYGMKLSGLLFLTVMIVNVLRTYLEYRRHTYTFEEEAFMVHRGYVIRQEIAIVYHQVQNVNIRRDMLDRMLGVSQVIVVMVGSNDGLNLRQSDMTLMAIDRHKAKLIQKELLRRARRHLYRVADDTPQRPSAPAAQEAENE
jgi:uncharacterized membrane protein YdbT with pleckstrin-like domain